MYGAQTSVETSRSGYVSSGIGTRDATTKLQAIRDDLAGAHIAAMESLSAIDAALDRIDGAVPTASGATSNTKEPHNPTLVGSLAEQVNFARAIAERAASLASRLTAIG